MSKIQEYLSKIATAVHGRDVRQSIVDAITQCYEDGKAGAIDPSARTKIVTLEKEFEQVKMDVLSSFDYDVFGRVNENKDIVIDTVLADGTYTLKYERSNGTYVPIGTLQVGEYGVGNIIDTVGYYDNYRVTSSGGILAAFDGVVATGDIDLSEYVGQTITIRTKGVNYHTIEPTSSAFGIFSNGTKVYSGYLSETTAISPFESWTYDKNGNFTSLVLPVDASWTNPILRMSGTGKGENLIVTINEEIEY